MSSRWLLAVCLLPTLVSCVSLDYYEALREAYEKAEARSLAAKNELAKTQADLVQAQKVLAEVDVVDSSKPVNSGELSFKEKADLLTRRLESQQAELRVRDEQKASLDKQLDTAKATLNAKDEEMRKALHDLERSLKDEIAQGNGSVKGDHNSVSVVLEERILYDSGSAAIKSQGLKVLKQIAQALRNSPGTYVRVEGHTDNVPIRATPPPRFGSNFELSFARAMGVVNSLRELDGVKAWRLSAMGLADSRPLQANINEDARAHNRRVEIIVTPSR
ncbi:MAG TPA: OmpA family protein [Nitrospirales bacterium]